MALLTTDQAARLVGVSPTRLRALIAAGELPSTLTSRGHRRVREADVLALAERLTPAQDEPAARSGQRAAKGSVSAAPPARSAPPPRGRGWRARRP